VALQQNPDSATYYSGTIPQRPIRRRLHVIPRFTTTKGGEYCFMPSIRGLQWLADLDT
jgi:hypothetical protein